MNEVFGRSPLRWAGSKRKMLPTLSQFWDERCENYIEAFAGSACLFFHLSPGRAVLNDVNEDLVHAFEVLRDEPDELYARVTSLPPTPESYYQMRDGARGPETRFDAAIRFFYLNRYCFNGIYRTNKNGKFNVPYGAVKAGAFPSIEDWKRSAELLKRASLMSVDFEAAVLDNTTSESFVYLDPPYAVANRRVFSQYSAQTFGIEDLKRLHGVMQEIDRRGARFVVSYALSKETAIISHGWFTYRKLVSRNVAGFSEHRRKAVEVLISNFELPAQKLAKGA